MPLIQLASIPVEGFHGEANLKSIVPVVSYSGPSRRGVGRGGCGSRPVSQWAHEYGSSRRSHVLHRAPLNSGSSQIRITRVLYGGTHRASSGKLSCVGRGFRYGFYTNL